MLPRVSAQNSLARLDDLATQPELVADRLDWRKAFGFGWAIGDTRFHVARALDGGGHEGAFAGHYSSSFYLSALLSKWDSPNGRSFIGLRHRVVLTARPLPVY